MANESIFADDWRDCLRSHYQAVVRRNDQLTLKTLVGVMHEVGFNDDELRDLEFNATLRTEDVADDYVPDMEIMSGAQPVAKPEAPAAEPTPAPEPEALAEPVPEPEAVAEPEAVVELLPPEDQSSDDLGMTHDEALAVVDAVRAAEEAALDAESDAVAPEDESDTVDAFDGEDGDADEPPKSVPGIQQLSLF